MCYVPQKCNMFSNIVLLESKFWDESLIWRHYLNLWRSLFACRMQFKSFLFLWKSWPLRKNQLLAIFRWTISPKLLCNTSNGHQRSGWCERFLFTSSFARISVRILIFDPKSANCRRLPIAFRNTRISIFWSRMISMLQKMMDLKVWKKAILKFAFDKLHQAQ